MKIQLQEINMYEIESLHKKILNEIKNVKSSFTLNFANVEKIDLCGIQLVISLKKYCEEKNITLKITNINSPQIKNLLERFSLENTLGLEL